jgi:hypothetical protein
MGQIDERRRKELVKDMTQKFGNVTVGIHGQELPTYSAFSASKEWWKLANKKDTPAIQSRLLLKQNQKYWAEQDKILLADVSEG